MPDYDWEAIRQEYIADPTTSHRKLADKYGISRNAVSRRSKEEGWVEERRQNEGKRVAVFNDTVAATVASEVDAILKAREALVTRVLEAAQTGGIGAKSLHELAAALQILSKLAGLQPDLDEREQKARIASIEAKAQVQEEDTEAGVFMIPEKWENDDDE